MAGKGRLNDVEVGHRGLKWFFLITLVLAGCAKPAFFTKEHVAATKINEAEFIASSLGMVDREIALARDAARSNVNEETKGLARAILQRQIPLRQQLSRFSAARGLKLYRRSVRGQKFPPSPDVIEREFYIALTEDRKELIKAFERQFRDGDSADIRSLAGNSLPFLKQELHAANSILNAMRSSAINREAAGGESQQPRQE